MIERIILDIKHSDNYTDHLFQTAALKNKRVIPMLNPSPEELEAVKDENTIIYHCHSTYCDPGIKSPIDFDDTPRAITVSTHYYIRPGGTVDGYKADDIRQRIEEHLLDELESDENLRETYKQTFAILGNIGRRSAPIRVSSMPSAGCIISLSTPFLWVPC